MSARTPEIPNAITLSLWSKTSRGEKFPANGDLYAIMSISSATRHPRASPAPDSREWRLTPFDILLPSEPLLVQLPWGSLRSVFELRQHFEPFLGAARQYHLLFGEPQRVVRDDDQVSAHLLKATD